MATPTLHIRPGHPEFLDLDWGRPINDWTGGRLCDLPTGVHRHPVRFVGYPEGLYAIKELPLHLARHEFSVLDRLQQRVRSVVRPVGIVERGWLDPSVEGAGAVITSYVEFAFPYRELISGGGFGPRRTQLLDAFAGLLVELHLAGCYWGDCSLSNVLYRYDAGTIQAVMIDGETSELRDELSRGQRLDDLEIMILNVAGGMADIAASQGLDLDAADLHLGDDIAGRYHGLWAELEHEIVVGPDERYRIRERIERLNDLGFQVSDVTLEPDASGGERIRVQVAVAARTFHTDRLRELTRIEATENQARQILSDLRYYEAKVGGPTATGKSLAAIRWRVDVFEPMLQRIAQALPGADAVQRYCDFLHYRYELAVAQGRDVPNEEAFDLWLTADMPGIDPEEP